MAFCSKRSPDNLDTPSGPTGSGSWVVWTVVLAVLIGVATLAYHHIDLIAENDTARARVENPVTSSAVPRSTNQ